MSLAAVKGLSLCLLAQLFTNSSPLLQYRSVAARGAMLFFLLNGLNKIHAFYQYSLNAFVTVFSRAIDIAPGEQPWMTSCLQRARFLHYCCRPPAPCAQLKYVLEPSTCMQVGVSRRHPRSPLNS